MGDGTGANESKNDPITFDVGNLVRFVGYNYTPEFIMVGEHHNELGVVLGCARDGLRARHDVYIVYWFTGCDTRKVPGAHLKLLSL